MSNSHFSDNGRDKQINSNNSLKLANYKSFTNLKLNNLSHNLGWTKQQENKCCSISCHKETCTSLCHTFIIEHLECSQIMKIFIVVAGAGSIAAGLTLTPWHQHQHRSQDCCSIDDRGDYSSVPAVHSIHIIVLL